MKIYVVVNARMPSEKAHGIHIAKMCEALTRVGHAVVLVMPARALELSLREFYNLDRDIPLVRMPSLVLSTYERTGFVLMGITFVLSSLVYLWSRRLMGERFMVYTVDIDSFSHTLLPLAGSVVAEMHSPKRATALARFFFRRACIVATNPLIAAELHATFGVNPLVEPNGVDESFFGLTGGGGGPLYVGRLYAWKGLEVLAATGVGIRVLGGTRAEFEKIFGSTGQLQFAEVAPAEVPAEIAKADVLLLIGTAHNPDSNRYTSPMKVFEYLATGKPVVASKTEALQSLIPKDLVQWVPPDDPQGLARGIQEALHTPQEGAVARVALAREHTWRARAERITKAYLSHA